VSNLLIGLLGALVATNQPTAISNLVLQTTGVSVAVTDPNDPVEKEYQKLLSDDDASQAEVDKWIRENEEFGAKGAGISRAELNRRIANRFEPIREAYQAFLKKHPNHVRARLAYGSFLDDVHDEEGAQEQWEKALELDPKNPAAYDNLAGIYAHTGPVKKAFEYYAKAIDLNPNEPTYYHSLGTVVYLFRKDAVEYYGINEQQVFNKALELYSKSLKLDPTNFPLASDVAQTYYGIKPTRTEDALKAWTNALSIANDEVEREGVYVHFARIKIHAGRLSEARAHLNSVTNEMYLTLKNRLERNLQEQEKQIAGTNSTPAVPAPSAEKPPEPKR
jgi:tetratricopeptide (TPR) repeat protein